MKNTVLFILLCSFVFLTVHKPAEFNSVRVNQSTISCCMQTQVSSRYTCSLKGRVCFVSSTINFLFIDDKLEFLLKNYATPTLIEIPYTFSKKLGTKSEVFHPPESLA